MKRLLLICSLAALFSLCAMSGRADEPPQRPCKEKDLTGTYILIDFKEDASDGDMFIYKEFPYQYLGFYPDHLYGLLVINLKMKSADELQKRMPNSGKKKDKNRRYELQGDGRLILYQGKKILYSYSCIANVVANADYKKGDLLLTRYAGKTTNTISSLYRRWY